MEVGMTWGSIKNSGEACVFCITVIGGASPPVWVRCKIHKPPQSFWHSLKSFELQFQLQFQSKFQIQWNLPYLSFTLPFFEVEMGRWSQWFFQRCRRRVVRCSTKPGILENLRRQNCKPRLQRYWNCLKVLKSQIFEIYLRRAAFRSLTGSSGSYIQVQN